MDEGLDLSKLVELGGLNLERGELDRAIRYYNLALKKDVSHRAANLGLSDACLRKGAAGEGVFYTLAKTPLRRILADSPKDETAADRLAVAHYKSGSLDTLIQEYREKAEADPGDEFYAKRLKYVRAMAMLDSETQVALPGYKPVPFVKSFFDFIILPSAIAAIGAGNLGVKFKPFLLLGVALFLFYFGYRVTLWIITRRR